MIDKFEHDMNLDNIKKIINNVNIRKNHIGSLDIQIVDHCNLNCAGCDHFSPLAEEWYEDIENFKKLMNRLKKILCNKKIFNINIMGGEPLLHKDIDKFCLITRSIFNKAEIKIVTNGTLLKLKDKNFFNNLKLYDIKLDITSYNDSNKMFYKTNISLIDNSESIYSNCINNCYNINRAKKDINDGLCEFYNDFQCCQLNSNGDFYFCIIPANIRHFNKFFSYNFNTIKNKDYINIYDVDNIDEIIKCLNKELYFCKYCNKHECKKWGVSKLDKYEWLKC